MAYYSPTGYTLVSGTAFTNPANAYDTSLSTAATKLSTTTTTQSTDYTFNQSVTGISALSVDIAWAATVRDAYDINLDDFINVGVELQVSINGGAYQVLASLYSDWDGLDKSGGPGQTYANYDITGFSGANLNTLKIRPALYSRSKPSGIGSLAGSVSLTLYEIRVNVTSGPSVGTINRTGVLQAGNALSLSCTTANEPTGVTWSQPSPAGMSGSFSGTSYSNPNATTTWTSPTGISGCSGVTYVVRCTAQTSPNPYSEISIVIPTITISTPSYGGGTVLTGQTKAISVSVGNDSTGDVSFSKTGGTWSGTPYVNVETGVISYDWIAPSTAGNYTITVTSNKDPLRSNYVTITVANAFTPVKELTPIPTTGTARQLFHNGFNYSTGNLDAPTTVTPRQYELSAANPATTTPKPFFFKGQSVPAVIRARVWPAAGTNQTGTVVNPSNAFTNTDKNAVASGTNITSTHLSSFLSSDVVNILAVDPGYGDLITTGGVEYQMTAAVSDTYTIKAILEGDGGAAYYDPGYNTCYDCDGRQIFLMEREVHGWVNIRCKVNSLGTFSTIATYGDSISKFLFTHSVALQAGDVLYLRFECVGAAQAWTNPCGCSGEELRIAAIPNINLFMCCME